MLQKFVHISHILGAHDQRFLEAAHRDFDEVHLITFCRDPLPHWLSSLPKVIVHNLEKEGRPYDDPDESRYSKFWERLWIHWNLRRYSREVSKLIQKIRPNIVQGMWVPTDGFLASETGHHPLVIAPFVTDVVKKPLISSRLYKKIGSVLQKADRIVVDCNWVKDQVQTQYPQLKNERFCVFPRGVDLDIFYPSQMPTTNAIPILICNRLFEKVYDHETLFRAFDLLDDDFPFSLKLIGDGSLKSILQNRVNGSRWGKKVQFLGKISLSEMAEQLRQSDAYISCAQQDGTSVSLLEAMATGLPSIVTDLPVNREWVVHKKTGYLFKPGSPDALTDVLKTLFLHLKTQSDMGDAALQIAREKADWSKHRQTLLGLYKNLMQRYQFNRLESD